MRSGFREREGHKGRSRGRGGQSTTADEVTLMQNPGQARQRKGQRRRRTSAGRSCIGLGFDLDN